ncbi:MAG: hypothetical protein QOE90_3624 [Thermoplasmata archaeon]|nr:hypothetical protein [Thermoplasmata archaeon]
MRALLASFLLLAGVTCAASVALADAPNVRACVVLGNLYQDVHYVGDSYHPFPDPPCIVQGVCCPPDYCTPPVPFPLPQPSPPISVWSFVSSSNDPGLPLP